MEFGELVQVGTELLWSLLKPKVKRLNKMIHPKSRQAMEIAAKETHASRLAK